MQRILLAEDNDANRMIARAILEREKFDVTTSRDGQSALKLCDNKTYDIILLDIMMPGMDGLKTLRRLREHSNVSKVTPIFALTAYCSPSDQNRYRMAGFDGILAKPLKTGQLGCLLVQFRQGHIPLVPQKTFQNKMGAKDIPWLDHRVIEQLLEIKNEADKGALQNVQKHYWQSVKQALETIQAHKQNAIIGDLKAMSEFRGAVHAIKGASSTIGLLRVSRIAQALQNAPPGDVLPLLNDLCDCLGESKPKLAKALR